MIKTINLSNIRVPSNYVLFSFNKEQFEKKINEIEKSQKEPLNIYHVDGTRIILGEDYLIKEEQEVEKIPEHQEAKINLIEIEEMTTEGRAVVTVSDFNKFLESTWDRMTDIEIFVLHGRRILISVDRIFQERDTAITKTDMQYV